MRFKSILWGGVLLVGTAGLGKAQPHNDPLAKEASRLVKEHLRYLRLDESDLKISPGWELPLTIPAIENLFFQPLNVPTNGSAWADRVEFSTSSADLLGLAYEVLFSSPMPSLPEEDLSSPPSTVPPSALKGEFQKLWPVLHQLQMTLSRSRPLMEHAVNSVPQQKRFDYLSLYNWPNAGAVPIQQEISSRRIKSKFEGMATFSQESMLNAARPLLWAVETAVAELREMRVNQRRRVKWKTPDGLILVGGIGDDVYKKKDLENVTLLIDLGGKNTYLAPVAAATENQIRIAIDLGSDVTIKNKTARFGSSGSGVFGIGILALPNEQGQKKIQSGSFAQGCGIAGVGALLLNGSAILSADHYVQGAGAFGVGIFSSSFSTKSEIVANQNGQGSAFVRGVGIFRHHGDNADIKGGLVQPDPREPKGSLSLCQGVGFGHRAFAGGGLGIATVTGERVSVKGSYFSQGAGYWHAFGIFRLRGNESRLQARRYDMGSGVHSAFGHFEVLGDNNKIFNWGVGPAYGWDHSIGSSLLHGNGNEMQVDWGAGVASIGSLSFSYFKSNQGLFKVTDMGRGQFFRNESSYSLQLIHGTGNKIQCLGGAKTENRALTLLPNTRGLLGIEGGTLIQDLHLPPAEWPDLPQENARKEESVDLQARLQEAKKKSAVEEIADTLDVAAAFSLDRNTPRKARKLLMDLPSDKIPALIETLDPLAIDVLIQQNLVIPAHGDAAASALFSELPSAAAQKKSLIIHFLRLHRPSLVMPAMISGLDKEKDYRIVSSYLRTMGQMLNRDTGTEPGLRAVLEKVGESLNNPDSEAAKNAAGGFVGKMIFPEAFGLLSTCASLTTAQREQFLEDGPDDVTSPVGDKAGATFLRIVGEQRETNAARIREEINILDTMEPIVRQKCAGVLKSTQSTEVMGAIVALGQIGNSKDAGKIAPFLNHERAVIRDAAAVALGRMGEEAVPFFIHVFETGTPRTRSMIMAAVPQIKSERALPLIKKGIKDPDPLVRLTAIAALSDLPESLLSYREELLNAARKRENFEEDPNVRLAISLLR